MTLGSSGVSSGRAPGLSILTFNAGLLNLGLGRRSVFRFTQYVEERRAALSGAIRGIDADIVALQEIYSLRTKRRVESDLRALYPHAFFEERESILQMGNGLLLLSKHPLSERTFRPFRSGFITERIIARTGALGAIVNLPSGDRVAIVNVHTTAGTLFLHPESPRAERARAAQLGELIEHARGYRAARTVLAGDMNCGPGVSQSNFDILLAEGFVDSFAVAPPSDAEMTVTWDPANPLNSGSLHSMCPPQRIDHVLLATAKGGPPLSAVRTEIVFRAPFVLTSAGEVTLSDHYGVFVELATKATEVASSACPDAQRKEP